MLQPMGLWGEVLVLAGMAAGGGKGEISLLRLLCFPRSQWGPSGLWPEAPQHLPSRRHLLCSAATDGGIACWDITSLIADAVDALNEAKEEVKPLGECSGQMAPLCLLRMPHCCLPCSLWPR